MKERILIVEDDRELRGIMESACIGMGCEVDQAADGETGLQMAIAGEYDLILLDLGLPRLNGIDVCRGVREKNERVLVMMITSRADETDKVEGLSVGADDYLVKPFGLRELVARVQALFRRRSRGADAAKSPARESAEPARIDYQGLLIDAERRQVSVEGKEITLTATEFDLLYALASNPGIAFTRDRLMEDVWGYNSSQFNGTINAHVSRLRSKIEPDPDNPRYIFTLRGYGYRFGGPE